MNSDPFRFGLSCLAGALALLLATPTASAQFLMDSTPVSACAGVFTDTGGTTGPYQAFEVLGPKTFTPSSGTTLVMDFTFWDVEGGSTCQFDNLTIYDGPTNADPIIGTFCGSTGSPGTVVSTHPTGALTFEWISDNIVQNEGWEATILCPVGTPYDDCTAAFSLPMGTSSRTLGGTPPDGSTSCGAPGTDDWYTFTAPFDGILVIDTIGSVFDTLLSLHSACPGTAGNELDCNDNGIGLLAALQTQLTGGQTVLLRIGADGNSATTLPYTLNVDFVPLDNCNSATDASAGGTFTGNLNGLAADGDSSCDCPSAAAGPAGTDIWFSYTSPGNGSLRIDTDSSSFDTVISVHSACPGTSGNEIACNDDFNGTLQSEVLLPVVTGQSFLVRLAAKCDDVATDFYNIEFDFEPETPCTAAIDASFGGFFGGNLNGLPGDGSSTCDCPVAMAGSPGTDVWFTYTAPNAGSLTIDAGGSSFDSILSLHPACPGTSGNETMCDDNGNGDDGLILLPVTAGQNFLVRLAALCDPAATGTYSVSFNLAPLPPANDDCANAMLLPNGLQTFTWDNTGATTDGVDTTGFCDYGASGTEINENDVWYLWTPDASGCVYMSHFGLAGVDTRLTLYDSTVCPDDPASIVACVDDEVLPIAPPFEAGMDVTVSAGTQYLIRCGTFSPFTPQGAYQMTIAAGPQADANNTSGGPQFGAPGCAAGPVFPTACFGDGGDGMGCTPCPCGNNTPPGSGTGCQNSSGVGAELLPSGSASVTAADPGDLRFELTGGTPSSFAVLTSGNAIAPANAANPCFGMDSGVQSAVLDGLRCAVQSTQRHGGRPVAADGTVGSTTNGWGGASGPPSGLAAQGGFTAGQTRHYQVFYRELPGMICLSEQNTSQAVTVTFEP